MEKDLGVLDKEELKILPQLEAEIDNINSILHNIVTVRFQQIELKLKSDLEERYNDYQKEFEKKLVVNHQQEIIKLSEIYETKIKYMESKIQMLESKVEEGEKKRDQVDKQIDEARRKIELAALERRKARPIDIVEKEAADKHGVDKQTTERQKKMMIQ